MPVFAVVDTRFLQRRETEVLRGTLRSPRSSSQNRNTPYPVTLAFRPDLSEYNQKVAVQNEHRRRHEEWCSQHSAEAKAKAQGTLVSVLQEQAKLPEIESTECGAENRKLRGRQQQVLTLAFLIIEAHRAKKERMSKQKNDQDIVPTTRKNSNKRTFDIGDPSTVNLLFSDVNLLLQQQDSAKVDVTQYIRGQIAELNMWQ